MSPLGFTKDIYFTSSTEIDWLGTPNDADRMWKRIVAALKMLIFRAVGLQIRPSRGAISAANSVHGLQWGCMQALGGLRPTAARERNLPGWESRGAFRLGKDAFNF